jgi:hypothetical protein
MLVCPSAFSLVVVEGVPKALKRYHKLMLRRINWAEAPPAAGDAEMEEEEEEGGAADKQANSCHLVWEVSDGGCFACVCVWGGGAVCGSGLSGAVFPCDTQCCLCPCVLDCQDSPNL